MLFPKVSLEFTSIGCNKLPQVASWGYDGLLAFGAYNYIALYYPEDPESKGVIATLSGHKDKVNCVEFINRGDETNQTNIAIVSGSTDKTARIWKKNRSGKWINSAILESHNESINTLGVIRSGNITIEKDLFATGSSDCVIKIWERSELDDTKDLVECIQTINLGTKYPLALAISYLPESKVPILACGSTDKKVLLFVQKNNQFVESLSLQGHENWVRSLSFATYTTPISPPNNNIKQEYKLQGGDLLLASGSQDKYVRLWKFNLLANVSENGALSGGKVQLSTKAHIIDVEVAKEGSCNNQRYSVMFEALLMGHDDWVYSVCWQPPCLIKDFEGNLKYHQPMTILTSSSDKSMMIWKPEADTGVWVNLVRVGEIGGYTLGFFGGLFNKEGNCIIGHGHTGAFHLWKNVDKDESDEQNWKPQVSISGHFNSVKDISWDKDFNYLVSVSLDQTARLFAPWCRKVSSNDKISLTWHEIARPQIHGYDIHCICFVNKWRYVSGSDEKESKPLGANLPALGLSNKAVFQTDIENFEKAAQDEEFLSRQSYVHSSSTPNSLVQTLSQPPFEEHLLQHTLWPEIDKLYGHGFELISVGASHDGKYVASACKAASAEHAVIRLYDTSTWKELPNPLQSHTLTVTQTKFSHNDKYLLTVSRDRMWSIFERYDEGTTPYKFVTKNRAHARIIWDCSWSHDDTLFATGSRDKTVKIWTQIMEQEQIQWKCIFVIKLQEAVTAIDFAPILINQRYLLAIGLENGKIIIYQSDDEQQSEKWNEFIEVDKDECHICSVNRLMWKSKDIQQSENVKLQLASCGSDYCVRLLNIIVENHI
ncbi:7052_t:CDS:10 [Funneliformis mosseae]|uniref:Elongator complex protein 2 n=1 Tax=Funneliformis mosseae TaxID=27381 RepID=A0A9N9EYT4_FUNMO|nr:7052_t:CDS:10 [Funneliformis mosseae]